MGYRSRPGKIPPSGSFRVFHPDTDAVAAGDEVEQRPAGLHEIRGAVGVGRENLSVRGCAVDREINVGEGDELDDAVLVEDQGCGLVGSVRQTHGRIFRRSDGVRTRFQPEESGEREPAVVGGEAGLPLGPGGLDLGRVGGFDGRRGIAAGGEGEDGRESDEGGGVAHSCVVPRLGGPILMLARTPDSV